MREYRHARIFWRIALLLAGVAIGGCGVSNPPPRVAKAGNTVTTVSVVYPQRKALRRIIEQPGSVQAYEDTLLFSRVPGNTQLLYEADGKLTHDIGRKIHGPKFDSDGVEIPDTGEVLAELVIPELEQEKNQKEALVRQARAETDQAAKALLAANATIAVVEAMVGEAKAQHDRWKSEKTRMASLAKDKIIDTQSSEETLNQFKASEARLASVNAAVLKAKADRDKAESDVLAAKAHVEVAAAEALRAKAMWGYGKIRAPFDGIITARKATKGKYVQPASGVDDWLFKVSRLDPVRIVIAVPEADAGLVKEDAEVRMTIQADSPLNRSGKVARTSWALDPGSRTLRTEIDLPNKDDLLRPGMFVSARIIHSFPAGWTLPVSAVVQEDSALVCFLIQEGKAVRTPVQVGGTDGQYIVVLKLQKRGSSSWEELLGNEPIAVRAGVLTDGQTVQSAASTK